MKFLQNWLVCLLLLSCYSLSAQQETRILNQVSVTPESFKLTANQPHQFQVSLSAGEVTNFRIHLKKTANFKKIVGKLIPFIVAGGVQRGAINPQQSTADGLPSFSAKNSYFEAGAGIALGELYSSTHSKLKHPVLAYSLYNESGMLLTSQTKRLKQRNELIRLSTGVQNGYAIVKLISPTDHSVKFNGIKNTSRANRKSSIFESRIESRFVLTNPKTKTETPFSTENNPNRGTIGGAKTNGTGYEESDAPPEGMVCTDWYIVTTNRATGEVVSEEYVGRSCVPTGGGAVNQAERDCIQCKALHTRERIANLRLAKVTLSAALLAGCHIVGGQTFVSLNVVGSWAHFFPGIGTAAVEAIAALGAVTVDISCLTMAVLAYNAAEASIEAKYYDDMHACGNCPY